MPVKLFLTSPKVTPEFVYKEYVPHFNWLVSKNHTECWITSNYPQLFTTQNIIPVGNTKETKKNLSMLIGLPIKKITSQILTRLAITPDEKLYIPFKTNPSESLVIPKASSLLKYLEKLKTATKIVTWQEIFVFFAMVHNLPCLAFYDEWNPNQFKGIKGITLLPVTTSEKTKLIDQWLSSSGS